MRRQPGGNASLTLFPCPSAGLSSDSSPCCSMLSHERRRPPKYAPEFAPEPVVGLEADVAARPGPAAAAVEEARRPHGGRPRNADRRPVAARGRRAARSYACTRPARWRRLRPPSRRNGSTSRDQSTSSTSRRRCCADRRSSIRLDGAPRAMGARTCWPTASPAADASLRLRLTRRTGGAAPPPPLFAVIASQAADAGLSVGRAGLAYLMPTRFGRFEIADVALTDGVGVPRSLPWLSPRARSAGVHDVGIGLRRARPADDARGTGLPGRSARPRVGRRRPGDDRLLRRQRATPQPGLRRRRSGAGRDACRLAGRQTCHTPEDFAASLRICCGVSRTLN